MAETHGDAIGYLDAQVAQGGCQCITELVELSVGQLVGRGFDSNSVRRSSHHFSKPVQNRPFDERSLDKEGGSLVSKRQDTNL